MVLEALGRVALTAHGAQNKLAVRGVVEDAPALPAEHELERILHHFSQEIIISPRPKLLDQQTTSEYRDSWRRATKKDKDTIKQTLTALSWAFQSKLHR